MLVTVHVALCHPPTTFQAEYLLTFVCIEPVVAGDGLSLLRHKVSKTKQLLMVCINCNNYVYEYGNASF